MRFSSSPHWLIPYAICTFLRRRIGRQPFLHLHKIHRGWSLSCELSFHPVQLLAHNVPLFPLFHTWEILTSEIVARSVRIFEVGQLWFFPSHFPILSRYCLRLRNAESRLQLLMSPSAYRTNSLMPHFNFGDLYPAFWNIAAMESRLTIKQTVS